MKKTMAAVLGCLLLCPQLAVSANAQELLVGGQVLGIQAALDGILVSGISPVETVQGSETPAAAAGIEKGDRIKAINKEPVDSVAELLESIHALKGEKAELTIQRGEETLQLSVQPVQGREGQWRMGLWLRDSISGIGTLTFCDPGSGVFGALGHSISDSESGVMLPLLRGSITEAQVVHVTPGQAGTPGELNGASDPVLVLGSIERNTDHGIYGQAFTLLGGRSLPVGQLRTGTASILSTVAGTDSEEYTVEINRIYHDQQGEHLMLTVTDPVLLERTGGIVQGMSGSPILQDGQLVGAVTHVFVNDPARGYGVSIQDMLRSAGLAVEKQAA